MSPVPLRAALAALACGLLAAPASAYNVFPYGEGQALKWGANTIGTSGGIVTWSLMADGTGIDPDAAAALGIGGTSSLSSVFAQVGGQAAALAALQAAFDAWSSVADIRFVRVEESGALPFASASAGGAVVGQIRIGAFSIGGYAGAVGYAPPPNGGTTLEGDIIFNADNRFGLPAGNEGELYELYPASNGFYYLNDLAGLFTHELGHALGLSHSDVPGAVMCGYVGKAFDGSQCAWADPDGDGKAPINRLPEADDIAGIQYLYGPAAAVPAPPAWALWLGGLALLVAGRRARSVSAR